MTSQQKRTHPDSSAPEETSAKRKRVDFDEEINTLFKNNEHWMPSWLQLNAKTNLNSASDVEKRMFLEESLEPIVHEQKPSLAHLLDSADLKLADLSKLIRIGITPIVQQKESTEEGDEDSKEKNEEEEISTITTQTSSELGYSKFGGLPHVPKADVQLIKDKWDSEILFIGQIRLKDLSHCYFTRHFFPFEKYQDGLLYFFASESEEGFIHFASNLEELVVVDIEDKEMSVFNSGEKRIEGFKEEIALPPFLLDDEYEGICDAYSDIAVSSNYFSREVIIGGYIHGQQGEANEELDPVLFGHFVNPDDRDETIAFYVKQEDLKKADYSEASILVSLS